MYVYNILHINSFFPNIPVKCLKDPNIYIFTIYGDWYKTYIYVVYHCWSDASRVRYEMLCICLYGYCLLHE